MSRLLLMLILSLSAFPLRLAGQNYPLQTYEIGVGQTGGFGGLNLNTASTQLGTNEAQEAYNIWYYRDGAIGLRPGFSRINSTKISDDPPWLLYRKQGAFLVGDSTYIWKVGSAGQFTDPDSILGYKQGTAKTIGGVTPDNAVQGFGTKWVRTLQTGDIVRVGTKKYIVGRVMGDSVFITATGSDALVTDSTTYLATFVFKGKTGGVSEGTRPTYGTATEVNGNLIVGTESRGAVVVNSGGVPSLLGVILEGRVDSVTNTDGTTWLNRRIVDSSRSLTANLYNGYVLVLHNKILNTEDGKGDRSVYYTAKILTNDAVSFTLTSQPNIAASQAVRLNQVSSSWEQGFGTGKFSQLRYTVFAPLFTVIDTGTFFYTILDTGKVVGHFIFQDTAFGHGPSDAQSIQSILEFTTGQFAGQQVHLMETLNIGPNNYFQYACSDAAFVLNKSIRPAKGDKYVIYKVGVSGRHFLWYANQLVMANSRSFPNQIRWSTAGSIHDFAPANYRAILDRAGNQITAIRDFNGDLALWQENDTWKIPGGNLSTGQLIHSLAGIGCPAARSLVLSGDQAYWLTLSGNQPKLVTWTGGGVKFNVVGGSSVYGGGGLAELSNPIKPQLALATLSAISKSAAGIYKDHLILSFPGSGADTSASSVAYHLPTNRWSLWTCCNGSVAGSIFYSANSSPDSGQLYFGHPNRGVIYQFGNSVQDTGSNARRAEWTTKDFMLGNYREVKQLMNVGVDYDKSAPQLLTIQPFKNLPAVQFKEGVTPNVVMNLNFGADSTGIHSESRWIRTGAFFRSLRFKLQLSMLASGGQQSQEMKVNGFRFSILNLGGI